MNPVASHTVYIGLGSNMGNRIQQIELAYNFISHKIGRLTQISSFYETQAWGNTQQADFINSAIALRTSFKPAFVLHVLLEIERELGRLRIDKWEPRPIDLDILYFDSLVFSDQTLKVPHPEIANRRFVLEPLCEIAPEVTHPVLQLTTKQLLDQCTDALKVLKI